jgi:catechol 2,3-dioxygenase-like lactoylglutathione lyase family enzyme
MFADAKAFGAFAVDDLAQARKFYDETLGLRVSGEDRWLTLHLAGGGDIRVYPRPGHTPAAYTVLMFQVDDIEAAVGELVQGPGRKHPRGAAGTVARAALEQRNATSLRRTVSSASPAYLTPLTRQPEEQT